MNDKIIITPLGTVSPYIDNSMNCPGFLVEYHDKKILLDCGNGISRLLKFPDVMKNLSIIITHYHRDHYSDIGAFQYASRVFHKIGMLDDKIDIYLPKNDFQHGKEWILSNRESYANYHEYSDGYSFNIDDLTITLQDNRSHTIESFMVKLENENNKVVYTSDIGTTNYYNNLCFIKDADLLICESSFLLSHEVFSTTHMLAYAAGILARDANVKKLMLTHFWSLDDKTLYQEEAKQNFDNVVVAIEGEKTIVNNKTKSR